MAEATGEGLKERPFVERFGKYSIANESLPAIVAGLDVQSEDPVLTIGADQCFALLEDAQEVTVCEIDSYYLELIERRKALLNQGKLQEFLQLDVPNDPNNVFVQRRNSYFQNPGRLKKIRAKVGALTVVGPDDIIKFAIAHPNFSKLYLSNALGGFGYSHDPEILDALGKIAEGLSKDSLIYVAAHHPTWESTLPQSLKVDEGLSRRAKELEQTAFWNPRVYRRVAIYKPTSLSCGIRP